MVADDNNNIKEDIAKKIMEGKSQRSKHEIRLLKGQNKATMGRKTEWSKKAGPEATAVNQ